jgi:hypothetical protein
VIGGIKTVFVFNWWGEVEGGYDVEVGGGAEVDGGYEVEAGYGAEVDGGYDIEVGDGEYDVEAG